MKSVTQWLIVVLMSSFATGASAQAVDLKALGG